MSPALDAVWAEAFVALDHAQYVLSGLAARAAKLGAYDSAERLSALYGGVQKIAEAVESNSVPDWLAEQVEP